MTFPPPIAAPSTMSHAVMQGAPGLVVKLSRVSPCLLNFLFSSFHDLLPTPLNAEAPTPSHFLACAQAANVNRIGFLRHGQTGPAPPGGVDFDRLLTEDGKAQAQGAGTSFGQHLLPFYPKVLSSPAPRTMETAQIFLETSIMAEFGHAPSSAPPAKTTAQREEALAQIQIQPVQGLYDGTMQPEGSALFRKIGYAPLNDYVNSPEEMDRITSRQVLGNYVHLALRSILQILQQQEARKDGSTNNVHERAEGQVLWVVGHAVYLPSAALGVASLVGCDEASLDVILSTSTREAEGYLIDVRQSLVQRLYLEKEKLANRD